MVLPALVLSDVIEPVIRNPSLYDPLLLTLYCYRFRIPYPRPARFGRLLVRSPIWSRADRFLLLSE